MDYNYYQKEIETMAIEEMKKLQSEKLVKQVKHVYENVPYYKKLMDEKGISPQDINGIEDLHKLPFLTKADLRDTYPYGLLAKPLEECVRIQSTSGTTGRRVGAYIHKMTLTFGKIAAPALLLLQEEQTKMCVRLHMATACSPAVQDSMAVHTRLGALHFQCHREILNARFSL